MSLRISLRVALVLLAAMAVLAFARPGRAAHAARPHVQSASLVRSGGFAYYRRVLGTVRAGDARALARLSALLPARLPAARHTLLCADCRITRLDLLIDGRRYWYIWDASSPPSLRPLIAALARHG